MALKRTPTVSLTRRLTSSVVRFWSALPPANRTAPTFCRLADLVTRFTDPPVDPRPVVTDEGPLATSIASVLNVSRLTTPGSRAPSI